MKPRGKKKTREEEYNNSPPGQATKWLQLLPKDINNLNATKARLRTCDLQVGLKAEWDKVLDEHMAELNTVRAAMEAVSAQSEQAAPDLFTNGDAAIRAFKKDDGELKTLLNLRDKAKRKAAKEANKAGSVTGGGVRQLLRGHRTMIVVLVPHIVRRA